MHAIFSVGPNDPRATTMHHHRLPQEAEIASLPFVDRVCPHRTVASIADQLPAEGDVLVHCKVCDCGGGE